MSKFLGFWGPHQKNGFMCQWYDSIFNVNGVKYSCCEQYMMAKKAELFNDEKIRIQIVNTHNPKTVQRLGRKVKNFNETIWKNKRFGIVCDGNYAKFSQNKDLKTLLMGTGQKTLVEGSPYDLIWGIGLKVSDPNFSNPSKWRGQNLLGKAIMQVRDKLREEDELA
mgnify:CR=1 FL=1|jgi:ribA/ribD-fused uncharacterized protein